MGDNEEMPDASLVFILVLGVWNEEVRCRRQGGEEMNVGLKRVSVPQGEDRAESRKRQRELVSGQRKRRRSVENEEQNRTTLNRAT